jgi:hypothetical protein
MNSFRPTSHCTLAPSLLATLTAAYPFSSLIHCTSAPCHYLSLCTFRGLHATSSILHLSDISIGLIRVISVIKVFVCDGDWLYLLLLLQRVHKGGPDLESSNNLTTYHRVKELNILCCRTSLRT